MPPRDAAPAVGADAYLAVPVLATSQQLTPSFLHVHVHQRNASGSSSAPVEDDEDLDRPYDRTLFVAGLPLGVEEIELHHAFTVLAEVDSVLLSKVGGARVAHVVFETPQALKKVLKAVKAGLQTPLQCCPAPDTDEEDQPPPSRPLGLKKWIAEHRASRPGNDVLQKRVDAWITGWEAEQESTRLAAEQAQEEAEGWTLVTSKKGKNKNVSSSGVVARGVNKNKAHTLGVQKSVTKNKMQVDDFYRFQQRDKNRNVLLVLKEQFEEDKRKVAKLKEARKFRPY